MTGMNTFNNFMESQYGPGLIEHININSNISTINLVLAGLETHPCLETPLRKVIVRTKDTFENNCTNTFAGELEVLL